MLLYHGTTATFAKVIEKDGLRPRCELSIKGNWPEKPSRNDLVYLTTVYGAVYALHFFLEKALREQRQEEMAVVEIDTDRGLLDRFFLPDEDFVEQCISMVEAHGRLKRGVKKGRKAREAEHGRRLAEIRAGLERYADGRWIDVTEWKGMTGWQASLAGMGTCAYKGRIPPQATTRIAYLLPLREHPHPILHLLSWSRPSIPDYQFKGKQLAACNRWLFGESCADDWKDQPDPETFSLRQGWRLWQR
jgi:hypothetical protein